MTNITRTIAGHSITLMANKRYLATRPMNNRFMTTFPVTIKDIDGESIQVVQVIENLTYDEANQFINEFNNGPTSFEGRVW